MFTESPVAVSWPPSQWKLWGQSLSCWQLWVQSRAVPMSRHMPLWHGGWPGVQSSPKLPPVGAQTPEAPPLGGVEQSKWLPSAERLQHPYPTPAALQSALEVHEAEQSFTCP